MRKRGTLCQPSSNYNATIDQALNTSQASEVEDSKLLHIKIDQLEQELEEARSEKERVEHKVGVFSEPKE